MSSPEFEIICDEEREARGTPEKPNQCLTFTVDGIPSMKWFHKCHVEGLPETYYVDRCISRLKAGRSTEAFGGPTFVQARGQLPDATITASQGRGSVHEVKVKGGRAKWGYTLNGEESEETFPTEALAKQACAIAAFMTRGKLELVGKSVTAKDSEGNECELVIAHGDNNKLVATNESTSMSYIVGSRGSDGKLVFKSGDGETLREV